MKAGSKHIIILEKYSGVSQKPKIELGQNGNDRTPAKASSLEYGQVYPGSAWEQVASYDQSNLWCECPGAGNSSLDMRSKSHMQFILLRYPVPFWKKAEFYPEA